MGPLVEQGFVALLLAVGRNFEFVEVPLHFVVDLLEAGEYLSFVFEVVVDVERCAVRAHSN